ncbi:MAG: ABC transporter ATP-binding protein [Ilumatobacter sp.]|jgi:peptide/nickel transport system ATP-binding protein|uniref:ABC transporter ATP-binding protein n=1 Tax=Ilumatobacter sp. TaxID=1967498 RepID=UPI00391C4BC5
MAGTGTGHLRDEAVLRVVDLVVEFPAPRRRVVHAVSGVSFDLDRGETLGIVGESGCGKTTTGRAVMQLEHVTSGSIELNGTDLANLKGEKLRQARRAMQMIFQDPVSSLNPSRRVRDIVREGLEIWGTTQGAFREGWVDDIMESVGLGDPGVGARRPHEFSGGQCQRICIARALVMDPDVLILDEPVSALDVSVQAQILNLLEHLKSKFGLTMLFISHDLAVVKNISDRVMVMYLGKVCEIAETDQLYDRPTHPYTRALLASIPGHTLDLPLASELISGELPSPLDPPSGCRFRTRCPRASERCAVEEPVLVETEPGHWVACHHPA